MGRSPSRRPRRRLALVPVGRATRDASRGFSLAEVLAATAIMGAVLVSVCALYVVARQQVLAARMTTVAATLGEDLLDDLRSMQREQVSLLLDAAPTASSVTWTTDQANPAYASLATETALAYTEILEAWRVEANEKLPGGNVLLTAEAFRDRPQDGDAGTTTFSSATFLRLELSVYWSASGRVKRVTYNQLKF